MGSGNRLAGWVHVTVCGFNLRAFYVRNNASDLNERCINLPPLGADLAMLRPSKDEALEAKINAPNRESIQGHQKERFLF